MDRLWPWAGPPFSNNRKLTAAVAARQDITVTVLTSGASSVDGTSIGTASISPASNALIIAAISCAAGTTASPTASGGGMTTWTQVASTNFVTTTRRLSYFRALETSPGSGAVTFDFGGSTQTSFAWAILQFAGVDTSGTNGAGAIVQSPALVTGGAGVTTLTKTLAAFENAKNVHLCIVATDANGSHTADADFLERTDNGVASGAHTLGTATAVNQVTVDPTFTASLSGCGMFNLEIKAG